MRRWLPHEEARHQEARRPVPLDDRLPAKPHPMPDRACCCPGRPVVTVLMPPAPGRPHRVDLLLCGHHFRVSRAALEAAGAAAYDSTGALVLSGGTSAGTAAGGVRPAPAERAPAVSRRPSGRRPARSGRE